MLRFTGKDKIIQDLEAAEKLILEAQRILYRVPVQFEVTLAEPDTGKDEITDAVQDNQ